MHFSSFHCQTWTSKCRLMKNYPNRQPKLGQSKRKLRQRSNCVYNYLQNFISSIPDQKMSVFGVFLVRIFQHSNWIRKFVNLCKSLYSVECGKIRTRKTPDRDAFYAVLNNNSNKKQSEKPKIPLSQRKLWRNNTFRNFTDMLSC